ncbi:MAG: hypothetical protein P8163_18195, partial [Candidatus Thiodiazotropha sp.]
MPDDNSYAGKEIYYASSLDGWVNHIVTAGQTKLCYNPSIAVDNGGDIYITYTRTNDREPYGKQLYFTKKSTNWSERRISFTGYNHIASSDMDIDNNGIVHAVFSNSAVEDDPSHNSHIWYANSANSWINVQVDSNSTLNSWDDRKAPSIEVDSKNTVHVVWQDHRNTALPGDPAY